MTCPRCGDVQYNGHQCWVCGYPTGHVEYPADNDDISRYAWITWVKQRVKDSEFSRERTNIHMLKHLNERENDIKWFHSFLNISAILLHERGFEFDIFKNIDYDGCIDRFERHHQKLLDGETSEDPVKGLMLTIERLQRDNVAKDVEIQKLTKHLDWHHANTYQCCSCLFDGTPANGPDCKDCYNDGGLDNKWKCGYAKQKT